MSNSINKISKLILILTTLLITFTCVVCACAKQEAAAKSIGVAWCSESNYKDIVSAVSDAQGEPIVLPQVKYNEFTYEDEKVSSAYLDEYGMLTNENADKIKAKPYDKTNVSEVVKDKKAVVFPGGADICPSLYKEPKAWYDYSDKPKFDAARDVSDYILMSYCLDNDIPVLGICRGMQMYSVVSGCTMTQDLATYYASKGATYNKEHQKSGELNGKDVKGNHPVNITDKHSLMYQVWGTDTLIKPYSSHHQAVISANEEKAKVVATATVNGVEIIEGLERADSGAFGLFVQFHPEHSLKLWRENAPEKDYFMNYEESLKPFKYLVDNAK